MTDSRKCAQQVPPHRRLPAWLKRPVSSGGKTGAVEAALTDANLHTVCVEAKCPNRGECFGRGTATFLILGKTCSRSCGFCSVSHGEPEPLDIDEPHRVAAAVGRMGIIHAVITSVTRDDLEDGGAGQFAEVVRLLKHEQPCVTVEVLVPDFAGSQEALTAVLGSGPHVFNHNVETVERLYPAVRPQAGYRRSLEILAKAAEYEVQLNVKSGLMVGLGETQDEVLRTLFDMRETGCSMVTMGQYLRPSREQVPVAEYITPRQFDLYRERALSMGFSEARCGPFVRSSYRAEEMVKERVEEYTIKT